MHVCCMYVYMNVKKLQATNAQAFIGNIIAAKLYTSIIITQRNNI